MSMGGRSMVTDTREGARRFLLVYGAIAVVLNLVAISSGIFDRVHVVANGILTLAAYPMWRYLRMRDENTPFLAVLILLYALYFGVPVFLPVELEGVYADVTRGSILAASSLVLAGIAVLIVGYYAMFPRQSARALPRLSVYWCLRRARLLAVLTGVVGIAAEITSIVADVPLYLGAPLYFLQQLALVSVGTLYYMHLTGDLQGRYRVFLWALMIPSLVLTTLASGFAFPLARLLLFLVLLYIAVKKTLPFRLALLGVLLVLPVLTFKAEYRKIARFDTRVEAASAQDVMQKGLLFANIVVVGLFDTVPEELSEAAQALQRRIDLVSFLAYLMELTPEFVPYLEGETYSDLLWKFIPRFLYPDKPVSGWGNQTGQLYGVIDVEDYQTSINMPQIVEMYLNFGYAGVIIGMFLLSQIYALLAAILNHRNAGEWGTVASCVIFSSFFNIESNFALVYGGLLAWIALLYLIGLIVQRRTGHQGRASIDCAAAT